MFVGQDLWESEYSAVTEKNTVEYIIANRFDDIHIADLKESFENCVRVDSRNSLTSPFNFYNFRGINLSTPSLGTDAVNKNYVDNAVSSLLSTLYPVGSLYIGTQATCPLATLIPGSTWTKVAGDKVLQTSSSSHNPNTTIEAGLPNITGNFGGHNYNTVNGAFTFSNGTHYADGGGQSVGQINFNASRSSSIYGKSTTVQPPAYIINAWRRTA